MNTAVFDENVLSAADRLEAAGRHFPAATIGLWRRLLGGVSPETLAADLAAATSAALDAGILANDIATLQLAFTTATVTEPVESFP